MRFDRLEISCFRNLSTVAIDLAPGLNYFHGENGAGKTALLEAVHLLCRGRSFRTQRSQGLIQFGADQLLVRGVVDDELRGPINLAISKDRHARTEIRLNGQTERRLSEVARFTPLQVMLPDIAELVFGGPADRRSWLDWGTFHVKPGYLEQLRSYLRSIKQRNTLLREEAALDQLTPWNEEAARLGAAVSEDREAYLAQLAPHFDSVLDILAPELPVGLKYLRGWSEDDSLDKLLGDSHPRELKYGSTLWGPHRADLQIRVNGTAAANVLSRGQGKMVASALRIAQAALLADEEQRSTVFLIDDAGAELDIEHNRRFFGLLERIGCQILATTTRSPAVDGSLTQMVPLQTEAASNSTTESRVFHVEQGAVRGE